MVSGNTNPAEFLIIGFLITLFSTGVMKENTISPLFLMVINRLLWKRYLYPKKANEKPKIRFLAKNQKEWNFPSFFHNLFNREFPLFLPSFNYTF